MALRMLVTEKWMKAKMDSTKKISNADFIGMNGQKSMIS